MPPRIDRIIEQFDGSRGSLGSRIVAEISAETFFDFVGSPLRLVKAQLVKLLQQLVAGEGFRAKLAGFLQTSEQAPALLEPAFTTKELRRALLRAAGVAHEFPGGCDPAVRRRAPIITCALACLIPCALAAVWPILLL